jgi:hypothetical protein
MKMHNFTQHWVDDLAGAKSERKNVIAVDLKGMEIIWHSKKKLQKMAATREIYGMMGIIYMHATYFN